MKRFMAIFLLFFATFSLFALPFNIGVDARSLDFTFTDGVRVDAEVGIKVKTIQLIIPLRYGKSNSKDISLVESGLLIDVWPFDGLGLFAEASIFKVGYMWGLYTPSGKIFFSAEGSVGWEFVFGPVYLRPMYTVRSSFSAEDTKEERIRSIPQFGESRLSVHIGVLLGGKNDEKNSSV